MDSKLLLELIVVLGFSAICLMVTRVLRLGSTLAFLLTGFLLGPSVFDFITTKESEAFGYSSLGVVLMLFVIGLELEPKKLWALRAWVGGVGFSQVIICGLILAYVGISLGYDWHGSLVIGLGMAMSSTAMVLPLLKELHLNRTLASEKSLPVLLSQDLASIPLLLLIGFMVTMKSAGQIHLSWEPVALAMGTLMVTLLFGRYALGPLLSWLYRFGIPALLPATAGLLIFATAWVMDDVGLSASMGAFLSGMMLASSPHRLSLSAIVKPFKAWLLGLFFIGIGIQINLNDFMANPVMILLAVVVIVAIKFIVLFLLARIGRLPTAQSLIFAAALSQAGEFALVVIESSFGAGLVSSDLVSPMYTIVVLSMFTTPLLLVVLMPLTRSKQRDLELSAQVTASGHIVLGGLGELGRQLMSEFSLTNKNVIAIDTDLALINQMRGFHETVYMGDLLDPELYELLNLSEAEAVIIAYRYEEESCTAVAQIRQLFPDTYIVAVANGQIHAHKLAIAGASFIIQEKFSTSLEIFSEIMKSAGYEREHVDELVQLFRKLHDEVGVALKNEASEEDSKRLESYRRLLASMHSDYRQKAADLLAQEKRKS